MIQKYLATYAELHAYEPLSSLMSVIGAVEQVLCLPFYDESTERLAYFAGVQGRGRLLQVWIINAPDNSGDAPLARTRDLLRCAIETYKGEMIAPGLYVAQSDAQTPLLIVDQCSPGRELPYKQGVGLARKIALDLALKVVDEQQQSGQGKVAWLHTSDADVTLPEGYFDVAAPQAGEVGLIYPLRHRAEPGLELAQRLYDFRLDYYVGMLAWAGSPYAFQTVGSTIAVTPEAYAAVRGMPKRSGAEDFYLLNKLAKLGRLRQLESPVLDVAARPSQRVPFGTGPALIEIASMSDPLREYSYYHPQCFVLLKELLEAVQGGALDQSGSLPVSPLSVETMQHLGFEKFLAHSQRLKTRQERLRAFSIWFDAFLSLRFVHLIRDAAYPNVTLGELVQAEILPDELRERVVSCIL